MNAVRNLILLLATIGTFLMPAGAFAQADQAAPAPVSAGYVLGAGDTIQVSVAGADYSTHATLEQDGTVVLPLIGRVTAAGSTLTALRDSITARLVGGGYFVKPDVSVVLMTATSRFATVLGQVGAPGLVTLDRDYHLSEILARVGGVRGDGVDVVTVTPANGTARTYSLSSLATASGAGDPVVSAGDKIFVAPAQTFYVTGEANKTGSYSIVPGGLTIRQAVALAGGVTPSGSIKKVMLTRGNRTVKADLDQQVQPGDIIAVGQRFF